MNYLLIVLIALISSSYIDCNDGKMMDILKEEVSHLLVPYPQGYDHLIHNLKAGSEFLIVSIAHNELESVLRMQYDLPNEIVQKFVGIAFSQSVTMQSFCVVLEQNIGHLDEYVGVAYNDKNIIRLAYIKTHSDGALIPQYDHITERHCKTILFFFKKCKNIEKVVTRGFLYEEIDSISKALRANAYEHLNQKIQDLQNDSEFVLLQQQKLFSISKKYYCFLQTDGTLLIYRIGDQGGQDTLVWASGSAQASDHSPYSLNLKFNGNLEIRGKSNILIWQTETINQGGSPHTLIMQEDGNLVLYDEKKKPIWDSQKVLIGKSFVLPQSAFLFSQKGNYYAILQPDGNFVVYSLSIFMDKFQAQHVAVWSSQSIDIEKGPYNLILESNGNMVIYGKNGIKLWETASGNQGQAPFSVEISNDGCINIYDAVKKSVWTTPRKFLFLV